LVGYLKISSLRGGKAVIGVDELLKWAQTATADELRAKVE